VLVEGFRPGTLEKWSLGPDALWKENAALVVARVSGFGQTGPYARKPGFAAVAEAWGGLRHLTGMPGEPPVRANLSLGDTLAGLHAALGVLLALRARERDGRGQVVDVSLVESVLAVLESVIPEHAGAGVVRAPSGTGIGGVVPSDLYPCADGFVVIGANADAVFVRLMRAIGRGDLERDPSLARNPGRVAARERLDAAIAAWTRARSVEEVVQALEAAEVPVGPLRDAAGLARDPHLRARGAFVPARAEGRDYVLPAAMPRLERTPARTDWAGGALGEHTDEVLRAAGVDDAELTRLRAAGVIR
jgi:crotonobetainyl-CoA:carnitine CoA-transferase CaiB-like acyl-CoA transferase